MSTSVMDDQVVGLDVGVDEPARPRKRGDSAEPCSMTSEVKVDGPAIAARCRLFFNGFTKVQMLLFLQSQFPISKVEC